MRIAACRVLGRAARTIADRDVDEGSVGMTISGIVSGLLDPYGAGMALSRSAARIDPIRPVQGRENDRRESADQVGAAEDSESRFDTQDVVELSPAARSVEIPAGEERHQGTADPSDTRLSNDASTLVDDGLVSRPSGDEPSTAEADNSARSPTVDDTPLNGGPNTRAVPASDSRADNSGDSESADRTELTAEERAEVEQLKQRDTEVRQHEQAHLAAAGQYAKGGASFEYQTGPDGRRYAVGGEVNIDSSPIEGDPDATIAKMQQIRAAALAPAEPSGQDRSVAASAAAQIQSARAEQAKTQTEGDEEQPPDATASDVKSTDRPADATEVNTPAQDGQSNTSQNRVFDRIPPEDATVTGGILDLVA